MRSFAGSFLCLGSPLEPLSFLAPCGSPTHGSFGLGPSGLGWGPFRYALLLACASTPECLFRCWALPSLPSYRFGSSSSPYSSLFQSTLCFFSTHWFLRSLPLLLCLLLSRLLQGLLLFLSLVRCSWVCCFSCGGAQWVLVPPFGVLSLVLVWFTLVLSACSPVSSGHGGSWLWCLLQVQPWSFLLVVGVLRVFVPFVVFVASSGSLLF